MTPQSIGDFKRIEQEAIDDLREKSREAPKPSHKARFEDVRRELVDIFEVCKVRVPKDKLDQVCRHIMNLIDDGVASRKPIDTDQTIVEALKKIGLRNLVAEYRRVK